MIAAIYARKSPKSESSGDQSESVERQIAHAGTMLAPTAGPSPRPTSTSTT